MQTLATQNEIARRSKSRPILLPLCGLSLAALTIFAPISSTQTVERSPGWVVLPVEEYRTLHERAYPVEREPEPPPLEATLTRVDYDLRIDGGTASGGELASGRATLTIDVLKDGWVRVPIPALTEERRKDLVKLVAKLVEEGRVHMRQVRHDVNKDIRHQQEAGAVSEDEAKRLTADVQKLTDRYVAMVDEILKKKTAEVMEV